MNQPLRVQGGLVDGGRPRATGEGTRVRILVAEDDRRLADLLDQSLAEAGWDVEVVHDGRSAYGRALPDGVPYDVLLLDWMLPEMDGIIVCRRLRALVRRSTYAEQAVVAVGDLVVDPAARTVSRAGAPVELSAREFDVLHLLVSRAGQVVSRFTILDEVWDGETDLRSNVIDVHLASIRAK